MTKTQNTICLLVFKIRYFTRFWNLKVELYVIQNHEPCSSKNCPRLQKVGYAFVFTWTRYSLTRIRIIKHLITKQVPATRKMLALQSVVFANNGRVVLSQISQLSETLWRGDRTSDGRYAIATATSANWCSFPWWLEEPAKRITTCSPPESSAHPWHVGVILLININLLQHFSYYQISQDIGLQVNTRKTKYMETGREGTSIN